MKQPESTPRQPAHAPVAIIGIGCMFPKAADLTEFWSNIRDGVDGITDTPDTHWSPSDFFDDDPRAPDMTYGRRGGFLDAIDFDPLEFGISPRDMEAIDTSQLLGLAIAKRALADAGYPVDGDDDGRLDRDRVSVVIGVTGTLELVIPLGARLGHPIWRRALEEAGVDDKTTDDVVARIADSYVGWQENSFPGLLGNVVAGRIANRLDLHGTNCVVDAACASSLSALHLALLELETGRADTVITGGVDTFNDIFMYMCFSKTPALSPTGDARPFAANSDGTILGEGLGMMVLKRLADAERDGDRIYAVVRGMGSSSDGKGEAVYAPTAIGQARALRNAYRDAGVAPETIELIEAHGTGTAVGDATEIEGLTTTFADAPREGSWCALGSVKSMIGHTKAAAGAAGVIKAAMALHHRVLPPTIKVDQPNPAAAPGTTPFYVNTEKRPWLPHPNHPRRAGVSAFGFGGSNFHCVLEEYTPARPAIDWDGRVQVFALSASDRPALARVLDALTDRVADAGWDIVRGEAARTRATFDGRAHCRLTVVVERDKAAVVDLLKAATNLLERNAAANHWSTPQGIYFGSGADRGKVAAVFPGQGSQQPGMLRDLVCRFPAAQAVLATADAAQQGLADRIYPHPAFDEAGRAAQVDALCRTDVAQPAIGAVSLGALRVLQHFGVRFDATTGHSFGELTALCAAGRIRDADFLELARRRGALMAAGDGDRGTMLAVFAPAARVEQFLAKETLEITIANRNAPNQIVLSGATETIEAAEGRLNEEKIRCRRLTVAAAFHSPLVADASAPFAEALENVQLDQGALPVYANTTGTGYPADAAQARQLLAGQLAAPVLFQDSIENMRAAGVTTFVEVGPGKTTTGLIDKILRGDDAVTTTAIDGGHGASDLPRTLACLAATGHDVDLLQWDPAALPEHQARQARGKPGFTVPLNGANYTAPRPATPPRLPEPQPKLRKTKPPEVQVPDSQTSHDPQHADFIAQALAANQESLQALVRMQEQTAELHRRFLDTQEQSTRAFQDLVARQQAAFGLAPAVMPAVPAIAAAMPTPAPIVPTVPSREPARQLEEKPAITPTVAPTATTSRETAAAVLLDIVAGKTGYPAEMLELSMGLDADLGIDSIKRVEILSALQEKLPDAPVVKPEHLGELQTLAHIVDFLAPAAAATPAPAPPQRFDHRQHMADVLLEIVAGKTGYPAEMLELSMGLDADLGIDSIKRVEILSALQEKLPDAPVVKPEHLGELQTLAHIVDFLAPDSPSPTAFSTPDAAPSASDHRQHMTEVLVEIVASKTGYPAEMLELSMGLDADLGIDSIKRVEILSALQEELPDAPVVKPEHLGELTTLGHIVDFLCSSRQPAPDQPVVAPEPVPAAPGITRSILARRQVQTPIEVTSPLPPEALVWVTRTTDGLSQAIVDRLRTLGVKATEVERTTTAAPPTELAGLILVAPARTADEFLHQTFALTRSTGAALRLAAERGGALFASVSRLDGCFGLGELPTDGVHVLSGGLSGLTKTVAHEWPQVQTTAIDLDGQETDREWAAARVVGQILSDAQGEFGVSQRGTCTLELVEEEVPNATAQPFGESDVVIMTGGARGVTAEVAVALAGAGTPRLVLLGRSPAPTPEPDWLRDLEDETSIKQAILAKASTRLSPRELSGEYDEVHRNREILRNIARIEAAGSRVAYRSVDVRDRNALPGCIRELAEQLGPITGLVHGAGVLADSYIADKSDDDFGRVFATKVDGLRALLDALDGQTLKALVMFSSSTARFGRTGQADYAVANEVLNKIAAQEQRRRPDCRVVSVNWGPWDGGMVTPALREIFAGEGISVIDLAAGARYLVDELANAGGPVEVVVLGGGSALPETEPVATVEIPALSALPELPSVFERELDVAGHEFLESHVIDGKAVLPVAVMIEWLGHAALHGNPGLRFCGFDDLRVFKGVIVGASDSVQLRVCADRAQKTNGVFQVDTELCSTDANGRRALHARATIVLAAALPPAADPSPAPVLPPYGISIDDAYAQRLFHGTALQGLTALTGCDDSGIVATCKSSPLPKLWSEQPLRSRWIADPIAIDSAFQAMILWSFEHRGAGSLPTEAASYRQFRAAFPVEGTRIEVRITGSADGRAVADIDWLASDGVLVARMNGYQCVVDASLADAFRKNTVESRSAARR